MKAITIACSKIKKITPDIYCLSFTSPYLAKNTKPGQFLHIHIDPRLTLRRPFSVHKVCGDDVFILFRVRGQGTRLLSQINKGETLDVIGPLGNGFNCQNTKVRNRPVVLIAGGMGVAPLMFLAQRFGRAVNAHPGNPGFFVFLGAARSQELLCVSELRKCGARVYCATEDGSKGFKGTVTNLFEDSLNKDRVFSTASVFSCGPTGMFIHLHKILKGHSRIKAQVSLEQFMGCGIGICYACVIKTIEGYRRVCKDGPVFNLDQLVFA